MNIDMYFNKCILFLLALIVVPSTQSYLGMIGHIFSGLISPFTEQCDDRWVLQDLNGLERDLQRCVFGQELASGVIMDYLRAHTSKKHRKKPLVMNFHGWPGGGKSYVAEFIVNRLYKKGYKSKYVKQYRGLLDFPLETKIHEYQKRLQTEIEESVKLCEKSLFIFDEAEKYPHYLLDGIKAYLDYNQLINGNDFRESIFIFISNIGETIITNISFKKESSGIPREELRVEDFEQELKKSSYNEETGGFYRSDLIRHHLIDVVVPFLPLKKDHVESCIRSEMSIQKVDPRLWDYTISEVMERISFGPQGHEMYSLHGCKGVSENVAKIFEREKKRQRKINGEL